MAQTRATIPVAVVNGTGYGGVELLRLLARHPAFALVEVTARSEAGKPVASVFPHLPDLGLSFGKRVERAELVFCALPDHAAVEMIPGLLAEGRRVVDLSAAFRLRDAALYPRWYGYEHPAPDLLARAVYGLPEVLRAAEDVHLTPLRATEEAGDARYAPLRDAQLVACPGCYPTAAILALAPALRAGLIAPDIIVDAKSGVSGAGRALKLGMHYSEANEDVAAYGLEGHRHKPEIAQELARVTASSPSPHDGAVGSPSPRRERGLGGEDLRLSFTPHLVPMTRGILATCYAPLRASVSPDDVAATYRAAYADEPFVRLTATAPHTKWTLGSNLCYVHPTVDQEARRLVAVSVLDNLGKGAAGQAIQCANILCGLPEALGLPQEGVYP
ncbi:MAG TPA: NAGSA dehydrogenase family protein [Ktedonobacterales bacterium]|nr:NAGSA dehydrogenase family protein [Ktedonobacterales bacterium]